MKKLYMLLQMFAGEEAAAAPEAPANTGISPLAFNEVAPPQKFT